MIHIPPPLVLAIDDEPKLLQFYQAALNSLGLRIETASTAAQGLQIIQKNAPAVIILDIGLKDRSGLDLYRDIRAIDSRIPTIFITGGAETENTILAMALGAYEYLQKPVHPERLKELVLRAAEANRLVRISPAIRPVQGRPLTDVLLGRSEAMQAVYKQLGRVAGKAVTVLIRGESGTGKELVARAVCQYSTRSRAPFLAINCAAIPETLLESELFGHERGAFTGATERRVGKFEQCSGGTLFLDEVGDMSPLTQAKILRLLQEQRFERVGGNETIQTDVRLIAATSKDLELAVTSGAFRTDLYYRLNVYGINLPPLRERPEDLVLLAEHFLARFGQELNKEGMCIAPKTYDLLHAYNWPGNLREFQSVLKYAMLETASSVIMPDSLPPHIQRGAAVQKPASEDLSLDEFLNAHLQMAKEDVYREWQDYTDRRLFRRVLMKTHGNVSHAARILGIHRTTLRSRLEKLGILTLYHTAQVGPSYYVDHSDNC